MIESFLNELAAREERRRRRGLFVTRLYTEPGAERARARAVVVALHRMAAAPDRPVIVIGDAITEVWQAIALRYAVTARGLV